MCITEAENCVGWRGWPELVLSCLLPNAGPISAGCPGHLLPAWEYLQGWWCHVVSWQPGLMFDHPQWYFFPFYWIGISHNYPCIPLPLVISRCTSVRIRVSSSLLSLIQQLQAAISSPFRRLFPRQCRPSYLGSSLYVLPIASVPALMCSTLSTSFLNWWEQSRRCCSRCSLTSARKRGVVRSLRLPAVFLVKQPRVLLAFLAARAHCWFTMNSNLSSTGTSRFFFLQIGFLASWPPARPAAWGYSISDAGLCILMYWIKIIEFNVLDYNFVLVRTNSFEFAIGE